MAENKLNEMFYDVEENKAVSRAELMTLYKRMKSDEEVKEESFEEWLEIALDPSSCFLQKID